MAGGGAGQHVAVGRCPASPSRRASYRKLVGAVPATLRSTRLAGKSALRGWPAAVTVAPGGEGPFTNYVTLFLKGEGCHSWHYDGSRFPWPSHLCPRPLSCLALLCWDAVTALRHCGTAGTAVWPPGRTATFLAHCRSQPSGSRPPRATHPLNMDRDATRRTGRRHREPRGPREPRGGHAGLPAWPDPALDWVPRGLGWSWPEPWLELAGALAGATALLDPQRQDSAWSHRVGEGCEGCEGTSRRLSPSV